MNLTWQTPQEINADLAKRVKSVRKRKGYTQKTLAARSNVSYGVIKKFEQTGEISLLALTKIAMELDALDQIESLFTQVVYRDIHEVIYETENAGSIL